MHRTYKNYTANYKNFPGASVKCQEIFSIFRSCRHPDIKLYSCYYYYSPLFNQQLSFSHRWCHDAVGRASDLRSRDRGFESKLGSWCKKVSHTYVPLSPSSI